MAGTAVRTTSARAWGVAPAHEPKDKKFLSQLSTVRAMSIGSRLCPCSVILASLQQLRRIPIWPSGQLSGAGQLGLCKNGVFKRLFDRIFFFMAKKTCQMCQMCMRGRRDFRDASATNTGDGAADGTPATPWTRRKGAGGQVPQCIRGSTVFGWTCFYQFLDNNLY
jgi:hypothetical protein